MTRSATSPTGDVLVEGNRIADVRPSIELGSGEAEIIDGTGRIVIPGLINAHMHTWQTGLRGFAANWTLLEYFRRMPGLRPYSGRGYPYRNAGRRAEPDQLRHHYAGRLVPQQSDA